MVKILTAVERTHPFFKVENHNSCPLDNYIYQGLSRGVLFLLHTFVPFHVPCGCCCCGCCCCCCCCRCGRPFPLPISPTNPPSYPRKVNVVPVLVLQSGDILRDTPMIYNTASGSLSWALQIPESLPFPQGKVHCCVGYIGWLRPSNVWDYVGVVFLQIFFGEPNGATPNIDLERWTVCTIRSGGIQLAKLIRKLSKINTCFNFKNKFQPPKCVAKKMPRNCGRFVDQFFPLWIFAVHKKNCYRKMMCQQSLWDQNSDLVFPTEFLPLLGGAGGKFGL